MLVSSMIMLLFCEKPALSEPTFVGTYGEIIELEMELGDVDSLVKTLRRDLFYKAADDHFSLAKLISSGSQKSFAAKQFNNRALTFARRYEKQHRKRLNEIYYGANRDAIVEDLFYKLKILVVPATSESLENTPRESLSTAKLFGRQSKSVAMEKVNGALQVKGRARDKFSWVISDQKTSQGRGTTRAEVGRATFHRGQRIKKGSALTSPVIHKGVGPTRFADNRYSDKKSGTFSLQASLRDWLVSEFLQQSGIAAYRPLSVVALPILEWHPRRGWETLSIYSRQAEEQLRIGDLDVLSLRKRREFLDTLVAKIETLSKVKDVSRSDIIRVFATRMGRNVGLAESGQNAKGRRFFHGMLHTQNISVLGELVDFGENLGIVRTLKEMEALYAKSPYVDPQKNFPYFLEGEKREKAVFEWLVESLLVRVNEALPSSQRVSLSEAQKLFEDGYQDGKRGKRATHLRESYRAATRYKPPTKRARRRALRK